MVLVVAQGLFNLHRGMWDLVLWPGIEPEPAALGVWSPSHWTTGESPAVDILKHVFWRTQARTSVKSVYLSVSILWTWFIGWAYV